MPGPFSVVLAQLTTEPESHDVWPYVVAFLVGFAIAIAGHLMQSRPVILTGIFIAALAAVLPMLLWGG